MENYTKNTDGNKPTSVKIHRKITLPLIVSGGLKSLWIFSLILGIQFTLNAQTVIDDTTSGGVETFTVPAGVTSITVECIGGGGGGGNAVSLSAGGGGGGAYAMLVIAVTPGQMFSYTVGAGGAAGLNGQVSSFGVGPTLVSADAGIGVAANDPNGGAGGLATSCIGTTVFSGGAGGVQFFDMVGGGGGGAAGTLGVGGDGDGLGSPGLGTAPGGDGGTPSGDNGSPGNSPGGGGAGGGRFSFGFGLGAAGADGLVRVSYAASCWPGTEPSANYVADITGITATVYWTAGDGDAGEIVFLKQGSAIGTDPADNTAYAVNSAFGSGDVVEAGAFAVYKGLGSSAPITNLVANTTYYYAIYSFNGAGPCYLKPTGATGSFTTLACVPPTTQPSVASVGCIEHTSMSFSFTRGNGAKTIVLAREATNVNADPVYNTVYTANTIFGSGTQIGAGNYVVYAGNDAGIVTVDVTGLTPGKKYYFKAYEYNETPNCYNPNLPASASGTTRNPATYNTSIVSQITTDVERGSLAQKVVMLTVVIDGGEDQAATLNSIMFTSIGTTNSATDLTNIRIFYTGSSNVFSDATQFGSTFTTFGVNVANDNFALKSGNNYFWLAYDVKISSTLGDVIDATVEAINITDYSGTNDQFPTVTDPAGSRLIVPEPCPIATPDARADFPGCNTATSQGEFIQGVSFGVEGGTSFYPGSEVCPGSATSYYDETATNNFTVSEGSTFTFALNMSATTFGLTYQYALWIDWNNNGDFRDPGERYPATGDLGDATTIDITIPVTATSVTMRIWSQIDQAADCPYNTVKGYSTSLGEIMDVTLLIPDGTGPLAPPTPPVSCATTIPTVTTPVDYVLSATAIPLTAIGTSLLWYTDPTGGVGSGTAPTPTTTATGTQTYYVSQNTGCEGPRTQIAVRVGTPPLPIAPVATATVQPTCIADGNVVLTGLPSVGTWVVNPIGALGTGTTYTATSVTTGDHYYTVTNSNGCTSVASNNAVINVKPTTPANLSGTKTIGNAAGVNNYATFTDAINDLIAQGVAGPITFEAVDKSYTEQLVFPAICGASAANTITFKTYCDVCAMGEVKATGTVTDNYTAKIDGGKYYIFDRIKFTPLDATYSHIIELANGASNNIFRNSIFNGITTAGLSDDNILVYSNAQTLNNIEFNKNEFLNGSQAIYLKGNSSTVLTPSISVLNNTFTDQSYRGISLINADAPVISGNKLTTTSTRTDISGFNLQTVKNISQINNNQIYSTTADGTGLFLDNFSGTAGNPANIFNNMISIGSLTSYVVDIVSTTGASEYFNFYYNTVNNIAVTGAAFRLNTANNLDIRNNIFTADDSWFVGVSYDVTNLTASTEDYNDFDPAFAGGANSVNIPPVYVSTTDLHTEAPALDNLGTNIVGLSVDIDGEARDAASYMGADEFLGVISWTGAIGTDWNDAGNWSAGASSTGAAQVPTKGSTVSIPNVANYPLNNSAGDNLAECRNIAILAGSEMEIAPGKYFTVYNSFNNAGTFTVKSDPSGTGSFIPNGTYTNTGTTNMELYLSANKWHYVSTPIAVSGVIPATRFYSWDEAVRDRWLGNDFVDWTDGTTKVTVMGWTAKTSGNLTVGSGYAYQKTTVSTHVFTGDFNNGDVPVALSYNDQGGGGVIDNYDGWNMVGNPYPATINWNSEGIVKSAEVDNAFYVYGDDGTAAYNNYIYYVTGSPNSLYPSIAVNASTSDCFIAPGQAAMVRANTTGGFITIKPSARAHTGVSFYKSGEEIHPDLLRIKAEFNGVSDETVIRFITESTENYDGKFDAFKRYAEDSNVPQIYSLAEVTELAVNTLPELKKGKVVPLGIACGKPGKYTISSNELNFDAGITVYLKDMLLNKRVNLTNNETYSFIADAEVYKDRFAVVFTMGNTLDENMPEDLSEENAVGFDELSKESVNIYSYDNIVNVILDNVSGNENTIIIQDMIGRKLIETKVTSDVTQISMDSYSSGYYIVRLVTKNKVYEQKVNIKK